LEKNVLIIFWFAHRHINVGRNDCSLANLRNLNSKVGLINPDICRCPSPEVSPEGLRREPMAETAPVVLDASAHTLPVQRLFVYTFRPMFLEKKRSSGPCIMARGPFKIQNKKKCRDRDNMA
jgi:hypothetical protein